MKATLDLTNPEPLLKAAEQLHPSMPTILKSLPAEVKTNLALAFHSARTLAIALLAVVQEEPDKALAFRFHIPVRWVTRYKDTCLRALRRRPPTDVWHPPAKNAQPSGSQNRA